MFWIELLLFTIFIFSIRQPISNRRLACFVAVFCILFFIWVVTPIGVLRTFELLHTEPVRAQGLVQQLARVNGGAAAVHGILAGYAVWHLIKVNHQQIVRLNTMENVPVQYHR